MYVPPKLLACIRVSIQSCTQNRPSPKVQSLSRDWIWLFNNRLDYLHEIWHTYSACSWLQKFASHFLIFAWGFSYGLSNSKKGGKIVTKLWKVITKSLAKIEKSEAAFCRSALLRSFCENRLCLSQLLKKLNSTDKSSELSTHWQTM